MQFGQRRKDKNRKIGERGFRHFVSDERFAAIPGILETPKGPTLAKDIRNLRVLKGLRRAAGANGADSTH